MLCLTFHNFDVPLRWALDKVVLPPITREHEVTPLLMNARPVHEPRFKVDLTWGSRIPFKPSP